MTLTVSIQILEGEKVGALMLNSKNFASGSRGFFGQGKITMNGKRYQCQCQMVEIGSKPSVSNKV